jgi:hypothetical protein
VLVHIHSAGENVLGLSHDVSFLSADGAISDNYPFFESTRLGIPRVAFLCDTIIPQKMCILQ